MYISGVDPTQVDNTQTQLLGQLGFNSTVGGVRGYIYCLVGTSGWTGDGYVVDIDGSSYSAILTSTTTTAPGVGQGKLCGVVRAAGTSGQFGWVQVFGPGTVRVSGSAVLYTTLNSTGTQGQLDDDATAGAEVIDGIVLDATNGGAPALQPGFINWPRVGRTL
jgi:hypothetical protein